MARNMGLNITLADLGKKLAKQPTKKRKEPTAADMEAALAKLAAMPTQMLNLQAKKELLEWLHRYYPKRKRLETGVLNVVEAIKQAIGE
jgi:hypothetical protein